MSFFRYLRAAVAIAFSFTTAHAQLAPEPATVKVSVLSLFQPATLTLSADRPVTLLLDSAPRILDAHQPATIHASASSLSLDQTTSQTLTLPLETFTLTVPGKLTRTYRGALTIIARDGVLIPVITMDTETAVASIVAAESPPAAPFEALKAQAIASRSYLLANPHRHSFSDACDTTHCQFLRSPPAAGSPAARAAAATRNTVLTWQPDPAAAPRIVAAMYSRSCGGHTRTLAAPAPGQYPYYSVRCEFCLAHPALAKRGVGHNLGLCQLGAADLAARGQTAAQILSHFYPNTTLVTLP